MFSSQIFSNIGIEPAMATFMVNFANLVFVLPAIPLLGRFGRRSMMLFWTTIMVISLVLMTVFTVWIDLGDTSNYIEISCTIIFVGAFELSYGPIPFLYLAETCTDRGIAIATFI
jgi:MFS family permease